MNAINTDKKLRRLKRRVQDLEEDVSKLQKQMKELISLQRDIHTVLTSDEFLQGLGQVLGNPAMADNIKEKLGTNK